MVRKELYREFRKEKREEHLRGNKHQAGTVGGIVIAFIVFRTTVCTRLRTQLAIGAVQWSIHRLGGERRGCATKRGVCVPPGAGGKACGARTETRHSTPWTPPPPLLHRALPTRSCGVPHLQCLVIYLDLLHLCLIICGSILHRTNCSLAHFVCCMFDLLGISNRSPNVGVQSVLVRAADIGIRTYMPPLRWNSTFFSSDSNLHQKRANKEPTRNWTPNNCENSV